MEILLLKCNVIVISGDAELRHTLFNTRKVYRIIPKPASLDLIERTIENFRKEQEADSGVLGRAPARFRQLFGERNGKRGNTGLYRVCPQTAGRDRHEKC